MKFAQPPQPPASWNQKAPTDEESAAFRHTMSLAAIAAADLSKDFQARFATSEHLAEAKDLQRGLLRASISLGNNDRAEEFKALGAGSEGQQASAAPAPTDAFGRRMAEAVEAAKKQQDKGMPGGVCRVRTATAPRAEGFPRPSGNCRRPAGSGPGHRWRPRSRDRQGGQGLHHQGGPEEVCGPGGESDSGRKKKLDRVGKPLNIKFKAVDGRDVDLAALKGKVVLVDFWATWCGPCVAELPHVKEAYAKLHDKGFEIVGISFDQEKDALEAFVKSRPWRGRSISTAKAGRTSSARSSASWRSRPCGWWTAGQPAELEARDQLESKIEKLLAEK
jgi:thiol-disulfide isomerase/thioredoxin